jgi:hypothetical protein
LPNSVSAAVGNPAPTVVTATVETKPSNLRRTYHWTFGAGQDHGSVIQASSISGQGTLSISVTPSQADKYTITLQVKRYNGDQFVDSDSKSTNLTVVPCKPAITLNQNPVSGGSLDVLRSTETFLTSSKVMSPSGCQASVTYQWSVFPNNSQTSSLPGSVLVDQSELIIPANTLNTDLTYIATLTVSYSTGEIQNYNESESMYVYVTPSPFSATIQQGSALAVQKSSTPFALDADVVDPDGLNKIYTWFFGCAGAVCPTATAFSSGANANCTTTGCTLSSQTLEKVDFITADLTAPSIYTVTLTVTRRNELGLVLSKDGTSRSSTQISLKLLPVPQITISTSYSEAVFSASEYLGLTAVASVNGVDCTPTTCTYQWGATSSNTSQTSQMTADELTANYLLSTPADAITTNGITLRKNVLSSDYTYSFTLTVDSTQNGVPISGFATKQVTVNRPPSNGVLQPVVSGTNLTGTNLTGTLFQTSFTFNVAGFVDAQTPIMYQFGYRTIVSDLKQDLTILTSFVLGRTANGTGEATFATISLPTGTHVPVVVAKDAVGGLSEVQGAEAITVVSAPIPAGSSQAAELNKQADSLIANAGSASEKASLLSGMALTLNSATASSRRDAAATIAATIAASVQLRGTLSDNVGITGVAPAAFAATVSGIAADSTQLASSAQTLSTKMTTFLNGVSSVDSTTATNSLASVNNIFASGVLAARRGANENLDILEASAAKVAKALSTNLVAGAPATVSQTSAIDPDLTLTVQKNTQAATEKTIFGGVAQITQLTSGSRRSTLTPTVSVSLTQYKSAAPYAASGTTTASKMTDLTVYDANGNAVPLTGINATIQIPQTNFQDSSVCAYWDTGTKQWLTDGVSQAGVNVSSGALPWVKTVTCSTTHLTTFGLIAPSNPTPLPTSTPTTTPTPPLPTPTPPTPTPPTLAEITQTVTFDGFDSYGQFSGSTKTSYTSGYGLALGIWSTDTKQFTAGYSVSATASLRRASLQVIFKTAMAQALRNNLALTARSLTRSQLDNAIQSAITALALAGVIPPQTLALGSVLVCYGSQCEGYGSAYESSSWQTWHYALVICACIVILVVVAVIIFVVLRGGGCGDAAQKETYDVEAGANPIRDVPVSAVVGNTGGNGDYEFSAVVSGNLEENVNADADVHSAVTAEFTTAQTTSASAVQGSVHDVQTTSASAVQGSVHVEVEMTTIDGSDVDLEVKLEADQEIRTQV